MADTQTKQTGNKYEVKKKEKKAKKEKISVNLPNARRSIKRQRAMSQGKADYNDLHGLIGGLITVLLVLFILLGGINQRAFFETVSRWSANVGQKIAELFNPDALILNENGVYIDPTQIAPENLLENTGEQPETPPEQTEETSNGG